MAFAIAFGSPYHTRPNGSASESDRRRDDLYAGGLGKRALGRGGIFSGGPLELPLLIRRIDSRGGDIAKELKTAPLVFCRWKK
jgi:hypothetical protein